MNITKQHNIIALGAAIVVGANLAALGWVHANAISATPAESITVSAPEYSDPAAPATPPQVEADSADQLDDESLVTAADYYDYESEYPDADDHEPDAPLGRLVRDDTFQLFPLGATVSAAIDFMAREPDVIFEHDYWDAWLSWRGVGNSELNAFIRDESVVAVNFWADGAPTFISEEFYDFLSEDIASHPDLFSPWGGPDYPLFATLSTRRANDEGEQLQWQQFPAWDNQIVELGFVNRNLALFRSFVVEEPDIDEVLRRVR